MVDMLQSYHAELGVVLHFFFFFRRHNPEIVHVFTEFGSVFTYAMLLEAAVFANKSRHELTMI
jgi:hypothetical protein